MRIAHISGDEIKGSVKKKSKIDEDFIRDFLAEHNEKIRKQKKRLLRTDA